MPGKTPDPMVLSWCYESLFSDDAREVERRLRIDDMWPVVGLDRGLTARWHDASEHAFRGFVRRFARNFARGYGSAVDIVDDQNVALDRVSAPRSKET